MKKQNDLKRFAAKAALNYIKPIVSKDLILGVGTGSTTNYFIEELSSLKEEIYGAVASSKATEDLLLKNNIKVFDLNDLSELDIYIDGADEIDESLMMIKGGGGALTREKIVASSSKEFICIADESKFVLSLGKFPLPIEIIPMSKSLLCKYITSIGGHPVLRDGFLTDNGNLIIDVYNISIDDPLEMEKTLNNIPGVITCGLFATRKADRLILSGLKGVTMRI
ncbi:ribose 5-phosphate isomerase A [Candidatus Kinetoplastibacterium desouzaii TCC079E]|uniref:Ribose-5-phosphate isomerase A n=1 Tax=Candidatus Kinetoplastidibacterium desouzai TCC079E TaxID=1208919 RepID=M1LTZ6_9PROT|nr:ribose-5-phosphate isomerase RpiA [Candidatus Kinetoplastibacterium desouzaii]AGF46749.1 ribose 5-phosphate isomerase A [Candidatus Kinetoplastibacterium desouzaii TCC079E]